MELKDLTYVVFDLETTGLSAEEENEIIEIGAVKVKNGEVIDTFDELIKPTILIPSNITDITGITNEMVDGKRTEEEVIKSFLNWASDTILVAHNANFDLSFIKMGMLKYNLGKLNYDALDTLGISRFLTPYEKYHNLTCLMKRYDIKWDEDKHHRADYDSMGTSKVLYKMIDKLYEKNIKTLDDIKKIPKIVLNKKINDCEKQ